MPDDVTDAPTPATEPAQSPPEAPDSPPPAQETDWKAEAERTLREARKWEERAKANANAAKELEQVRKASMSDQEKAVDTARAEARAEVLRTVGGRLVDAEVRVATAGRGIDVDALLDGLDRGRFMTDDGEPDSKAIAQWVDRIAPRQEPAPAGPARASFPDLGQGRRQGTPQPSVASGAALYAAKHGKSNTS